LLGDKGSIPNIKMGMKPMLLIGVGVIGLGLLLHLVAMATPAWSTGATWYIFGMSGEIDIGPWEASEGSVKNPSSKVQAVRAMTILGFLAGAASAGAAVVIVVLSLLGKDKIKLLPVASAGAGAISFVFILLGVIIWAASDFGGSIGFSFVLSIIGGIGIGVGGFLVFLACRD